MVQIPPLVLIFEMMEMIPVDEAANQPLMLEAEIGEGITISVTNENRPGLPSVIQLNFG